MRQTELKWISWQGICIAIQWKHFSLKIMTIRDYIHLSQPKGSESQSELQAITKVMAKKIRALLSKVTRKKSLKAAFKKNCIPWEYTE